LFSAVISEHFSKNRVIMSVVAAKIWYLKNVQFLLGHPVYNTATEHMYCNTTILKVCSKILSIPSPNINWLSKFFTDTFYGTMELNFLPILYHSIVYYGYKCI